MSKQVTIMKSEAIEQACRSLAEKCPEKIKELSDSTYRSHESDKNRKFSVVHALVYSIIFKCDPVYLLTGEGSPEYGDVPNISQYDIQHANERFKMALSNGGFGNTNKFSEATGINKHRARSWETGARKISTEMVVKLSKILGCNAGWLLLNGDNPGWTKPSLPETSKDKMKSEPVDVTDMAVTIRPDPEIMRYALELTENVVKEHNLKLGSNRKANLTADFYMAVHSQQTENSKRGIKEEMKIKNNDIDKIIADLDKKNPLKKAQGK